MTDPRPATGRWVRDIYRDAVWESEDLSATEKAVAETYARHARDKNDDKSATADLAWLTYPRLMAKAGIGRRANVSAAVAALVEAGWLTVVRETSRRPTLYRITIPAGSSDGGTSDRSSDGGTTVVPKIASGSSASGAGSSDGGTQPLGPSVKPPSTSLSPARTSVPAPRDSPDEDRERDGSTSSEDPNLAPQQRMVIEAGCPPHLAADVVEFIEGKNPHIRGLGWWTDLHSKGHLAFHVQEALTELARPIGNSDSDDTTSPDCVTCHDSGKVEVRNMYEGDSAKVIDCPDCTNNGRGRCRIHPTYASRRCAACRGDRLARGNEQPRSGQRGNPRILRNSHENQERYDVPIGAYLGSSHQAYRNPEDDSVYSDWSNR